MKLPFLQETPIQKPTSSMREDEVKRTERQVRRICGGTAQLVNVSQVTKQNSG